MKRRECPWPDKTPYRTEGRARVYAANVARAVIEAGDEFYPMYGFRCECGAWHVSSLEVGPDGTPNVLLKSVPHELQEWAHTPAEGSKAFATMDDDDVERFVL